MSLTVTPFPERSGAYRWYYADVTAGDTTAVFIFMLGSVFSARYAASLRRGGRPLSHCAVNFALYQGGRRRRWVLSEYPNAQRVGETSLQIGASSLSYDGGVLRLEVRERAAPWGRPVHVRAELRPRCPAVDEIRLSDGEPHYWHLRAARSYARVELVDEPEWQGSIWEGEGYHDSNHGDVPLGRGLPGWRWSRLHLPELTRVHYEVAGRRPITVTATDGAVALSEEAQAVTNGRRRSRWGLWVPRTIDAGEAALSPARLVESSPFYARMESRGNGAHALTEVANFRRFHSPLIRWMAHFRTRVETA
ncbi:MAG TPA: carotenoid 1,2-hydratase [Myxococcaceae bacterium]|nr:carotenoid 1,2-hydratase [Myxococcaceae bacterium]